MQSYSQIVDPNADASATCARSASGSQPAARAGATARAGFARTSSIGVQRRGARSSRTSSRTPTSSPRPRARPARASATSVNLVGATREVDVHDARDDRGPRHDHRDRRSGRGRSRSWSRSRTRGSPARSGCVFPRGSVNGTVDDAVHDQRERDPLPRHRALHRRHRRLPRDHEPATCVAHDDNTLDGQNGRLSLDGFATH